MNIKDIRTKYPQYDDLTDEELAQGFHQKFYSDIPFDQFKAKIGMGPAPQDSWLSNIFGSTGAAVNELVKQQEKQSPLAQLTTAQSESFKQSGIPRGMTAPFVGAGQMVAQALGPEYSEPYDKLVKQWDSTYSKNLTGEIIGAATTLPSRIVGAGVGVARTMLGSAAEAALQPVTEAEKNFWGEKGEQAAVGAIGGSLGAAASKIAGKVLNPLESKAEATMRELGVTPTTGQMLGEQARKIEDFAQNLPLVGSMISNAMERQLFNFNKGVINKTLSKVGDKLPEDVIGRDAVQYANKVINDKYDDVLSKINYKFDYKTYKNMLDIIKTAKISGPEKQKVTDELNTRLFSQLPKNGKIDGPAFKKLESDLMKRVLDFKKSNSMSEKDVGNTLGDLLGAFKDSMRSQNQKYSSELRRIDNAYGDLVVMRTAAANTGAVNGVFSPKQYLQAVRLRDQTRNKSLFASGQARGQDIADAAVEMLTPRTGATVEGRVASQLGGGLASLARPDIALGLSIASPVLYSESGMKAMRALMRSRPEAAKRLGEVLVKNAAPGSITASKVMEEYRKEENKKWSR